MSSKERCPRSLVKPIHPNRHGRFAATLTVAILALAPGAMGQDARAILAEAEKVRNPQQDYTVDFRLRTTDPQSSWKERTARYTLIAHGKDHSFVVMREPPSFYPGTLLITEGRYWLLLPRSSKPVQLAPRQVLNGDIAHGDLARSNLLTQYRATFDGEEEIRGRPCWRLNLVRATNLAPYSRLHYWIVKDGNLPWKVEYYGNTGSLLKVAYYEDYREGALGLRAMRISVESHMRPGETTTLTFSDLRPIDASGLTFTIEGMRAFRNTARLLQQDADGAQASVEELLAAVARAGN